MHQSWKRVYAWGTKGKDNRIRVWHWSVSNRQIELNIHGIAGKQVDASYELREGKEGEGERGTGRSVDAAWPLFGRRHFASSTPLTCAIRFSSLLCGALGFCLAASTVSLTLHFLLKLGEARVTDSASGLNFH